jgi:tetratricopeptide (TPR) repeat protein
VTIYFIVRKWNKLERLCNKFINKYPQKAFYYIWLAKALRKQGKLKESIVCYKKMIAKQKDSHPYDYLDLIRALYEAEIYQEIPYYCRLILGKNYKGISNFARGCVKDQLYWYLAYSYYNLSQYNEAIPWLEKLLDYKRKEAHYLPLGYAYQMVGNYNKAIFYYEEAIKKRIVRRGQERDVYVKLGYCYSKIGEITKAIEIFKKILEIDKSDIDILIEMVLLYIKKGKFKEAEEYTNKIFQLEQEGKAYCMKALICMEKGEEEEADRYIKIALEKESDDKFINVVYKKIKEIKN